ncbi:MAG: hypothetical protein HUK14_06635 [Muribaculaceae bacterium]|nr:hypothetical protein [Muribaculaceae bacterium]
MSAVSQEPITAAAVAAEAPREEKRFVKVPLKMSTGEWLWPLALLFMMTLVGLSFYPAIGVLLILLINRFFKNKYDFLITAIIMAGSTGFIAENQLGFKLYDLLLMASLPGLFFVRKNPLTKKVLKLMVGYILYLVLMGCMSDETWVIQFKVFRQNISFIVFIIPLWLFANRDFDIQYFFRKLIVYFIIIMAFYAIDGYLLSGQIFLPNTSSIHPSTFYDPFWFPFSTRFFRKWPGGMYIILLVAYPISRYYKLSWKQWLIIFVGLFASRTMTIFAAFFLSYFLFQGNFMKVVRYVFIGGIALTILYFVDFKMGGVMRISTTIDQFIALTTAEDDEDFSEFGTGRMAQVIPKYEALVDQGDLALGWGFVHPELSTNPKYQIRNTLYTDISKADELATVTEVTQFNTIIHLGIVGLIVQTLFFIALWFVMRHLPDAGFYLCAILMASIMGFGGFTGLNIQWGLIYVGTAIGVLLLTSRNRTKPQPTEVQQDSPASA